jgi:hypothetical protein
MRNNRYIILLKLLREAERPRVSVTGTYFKALGELRTEASRAHKEAIANKADFADAARIWLEVQFSLAALSAAWFLPRRLGWGLALGRSATSRLDAALWSGSPAALSPL